ncbi:MAG: efflux RND transporter periplasmic adaptor subunit [Burkholderiaceae bacterium]|jgi:HlyD family secretion protein|nr:efflux RND transporter periplasmic adaptor subunit [Burkholderiaceae bacterium]
MADQPAPNPPSSLSRLSIDRSAGTTTRRRRPLWKRWWVWLIVLLAVGAAAVVIRGRAAPVAVDIATVAAAYPSSAVAVLNATGRVVAARRASVSSKGTGRLEWLGVQEGQMVKAGEVIARLENRDVAAQRDQATAQVEAARANLAQGEAELDDAQAALKRAQDLSRQNFISGAALDTAEARYGKARAAIETLKAQIHVAEANARVAGVGFDQTLIRAPFTGIVLTKSANVGDIVTPFSSASGTTGAVVTMADMETLEVEADVSESSIAKISVGQPAEVQLDAFPDLRLLGEVSRIVPTVDRSKATLLVKVSFVERDPRVLPDMSAKVAFLSRALQAGERSPVPAVRPEAIVKRDGRDVVYVVTADEKGGAERVKAQPVTPGARVGDLVRVDLAPGTRVVAAPPERLADGAAVTAAKK